MRILLAVIDDLFSFARTALFGVFFERPLEFTPTTIALPQPQVQLSLPSLSPVSSPSFTAPTISRGTEYFIGAQNVSLYVDPVISFDNALCEIPYGELVHVYKVGGRWAHIKINDAEGWVLRDALREQSRDVHPSFKEGVFYGAESSETIKVRMCIADAFEGHSAQLPLTDAEYVSYMLAKKGRTIPWPMVRPRTPGNWQKILRGLSRIHMSITAKTETVLEYIIDDVGHVCFVEAVFPDESIKVSSIGLYDEGVYSESMLGKEQWKELRPVFIEVG